MPKKVRQNNRLTSAKITKLWYRHKFLLGVAGVIVAGVVVGLMLNSSSKGTSSKSTTPSLPKDYIFTNIKVNSPLNSDATKKLVSFITETYQAKYLPTQIKVILGTAGKDGRGDEYVAVWNKENKNLNVLYVSSSDPSSPAYLRAWILPSGTSIDQAKAASFFKDTFSDKLTALSDGLVCSDAKDDKDRAFTVCNNLTEESKGDKIGIFARAPLYLPEGRVQTVVAACRVPVGSPIYSQTGYCP